MSESVYDTIDSAMVSEELKDVLREFNLLEMFLVSNYNGLLTAIDTWCIIIENTYNHTKHLELLETCDRKLTNLEKLSSLVLSLKSDCGDLESAKSVLNKLADFGIIVSKPMWDKNN